MSEHAASDLQGRPRSSIPWNRWDLLVPAGDAIWTPRRSVSVCIPARDPGPDLERTLAALSVQTYPTELIEVIVADDTSSSPIVASDYEVPFDLRVVRQDAVRFAAGRARNLAAGSADGDVFVFLDADVVPARSVLETYLRWFEVCDAVVPFGFTTFVDWGRLGFDELIEALRSNDLDLLDAHEALDDQSWREPTFRATNDLRTESADMYRTVVGATLAVSAKQYSECGGFRDLGVRGVEDIEFGYRLQNNGAILIPDRQARHWHQGGRTMSGDRIARIRHEREPYTNALLPVGGFRSVPPPTDSPVDVVPRVLVHLSDDPITERSHRRAREIRELDGTDVVVRLGVASTAPESAFAQITISSEVQWESGTARAIAEELVRRRVGTLLVVSSTGAEVGEIVLTRALRSVCRTDKGSRTFTRRLFGIAVVDAARVRLEPVSSGASGLREELMKSVSPIRRFLSAGWTKLRRRLQPNG